jgi:hypothetical protein
MADVMLQINVNVFRDTRVPIVKQPFNVLESIEQNQMLAPGEGNALAQIFAIVTLPTLEATVRERIYVLKILITPQRFAQNMGDA